MTATVRPAAVDVDVEGEFDNAAARYDLMVALNPGYHRHLRAAADGVVAGLPADSTVLDLGCGSGASTRALLRAAADRAVRLKVVGVDASAGMLDRARAKRWPTGVRFVKSDAGALVADRHRLGVPEPVDGILAAYLFRNVPPADRDRVVGDCFELLRPGGRLVIHEYSVAGSAWARARWTAVCWGVIIPLGRLLSGRNRIYPYLWRSVLVNDSIAAVVDRLERAGFRDVEVRATPGWQRGILHTVRARRP